MCSKETDNGKCGSAQQEKSRMLEEDGRKDDFKASQHVCKVAQKDMPSKFKRVGQVTLSLAPNMCADHLRWP